MLQKLIAAIVSTSMIVSSAQAARLTEIQGTVLVNTGDGFWEVKGAATVSAGDRVLVRGKGGAHIDYGSGCIVRVSANQTVVVASQPTCKPVVAASAVRKEPVSLKDPLAPPPPPLNEGISEQHVLIVGGLLLIGTATAAMAAAADGKERKGSSSDDNPLEDADSSSLAAEAAVAAIAFTHGDNEDGSPVSP
jgi:hypothetical protein